MRTYRHIIAAVLASAPTALLAQHPLVLEKLRGWNASVPAPPAATIHTEVMKAATAIQKRDGGCLPTSAKIESISPATGVRFVFEGILGGQIKNAWTVVANHPNCGGETARYNLVSKGDGGLYAIRINRGRSHANESLIGDTWLLAVLQADATLRRAGIECDGRSARMGAVRVSAEEPDLGPEVFGIRYAGSWSEVWPIELCGRTVEVAVRFTADGDGGAYHQLKSTEAKLLPAAK
jgi:hypothetical protein